MSVIYIGSEGCPQCGVLRPRVEEWCKNKGIDFHYLDAEKEEGLVVEYGIRNIPAVLVMENGTVKRKIFGIGEWNEYAAE